MLKAYIPAKVSTVRNCQVATIGNRSIDLKQMLKYTLFKYYVYNSVKICLSAEPQSNPKLWLVLIPKKVLYVAHHIYNVIMPIVKHE